MARSRLTRRPRRARPSAALLVVLALWGGPALADELLQAVTTPGRGKLQVCRNWVMYNSCNEYGHVDVPNRIAVGDELMLEFGSNPKSMTFPVRRIHFVDGVCQLYTEAAGGVADEEHVDRVTIDPCRKLAP